MLEKIVGKGFCLIEHQGVQGDAGSLIGFYLQRLPVCVPQKKGEAASDWNQAVYGIGGF